MALKEIDSNEEPNTGGRQLLMLLPNDTPPLQWTRFSMSMNSIKNQAICDMRYAILRPTNPLSCRTNMGSSPELTDLRKTSFLLDIYTQNNIYAISYNY